MGDIFVDVTGVKWGMNERWFRRDVDIINRGREATADAVRAICVGDDLVNRCWHGVTAGSE
jgi:hypothetical protein